MFAINLVSVYCYWCRGVFLLLLLEFYLFSLFLFSIVWDFKRALNSIKFIMFSRFLRWWLTYRSRFMSLWITHYFYKGIFVVWWILFPIFPRFEITKNILTTFQICMLLHKRLLLPRKILILIKHPVHHSTNLFIHIQIPVIFLHVPIIQENLTNIVIRAFILQYNLCLLQPVFLLIA